jgi:LPS-assembly lipoprotein
MINFIRFPILLSTVAILFSGCGFHPVYGDYSAKAEKSSGTSYLSQVAIDIISDREGQILRNNLVDRFYQSGTPTSPVARLHIAKLEETRTELDMTKSSESTRAQLRLKTVMTLTDTAGQVLLKRDLQTITSYNMLGSEFATRVTEDSARQSAINDLARQIELNLSLYYNQP